jgi:hypothetical protein
MVTLRPAIGVTPSSINTAESVADCYAGITVGLEDAKARVSSSRVTVNEVLSDAET